MLYPKIITEIYYNDSLEFIIACDHNILKFQFSRKAYDLSWKNKVPKNPWYQWHHIFQKCLSSIKIKFWSQREMLRSFKATCWWKKKDLVTKFSVWGRGSKCTLYILNVGTRNKWFDYVFRTWLHDCTIAWHYSPYSCCFYIKHTKIQDF